MELIFVLMCALAFAAAVLVISAGVLRCPACHGWHGDFEAESACINHHQGRVEVQRVPVEFPDERAGNVTIAIQPSHPATTQQPVTLDELKQRLEKCRSAAEVRHVMHADWVNMSGSAEEKFYGLALGNERMDYFANRTEAEVAA